MTSLHAREQMVSEQLEARGIRDPRVLAAMREVPRHLFVDESLRDQAYSDCALPIGDSQTISQPFIVALMSEALGIEPGERVLEIGTGSGYQSAVLAHMGALVYSLERIEALSIAAAARLQYLGYASCRVRCADGNEGWAEEAPFDAIVVTAAAREIPRALFQQLPTGGRMVLPLGGCELQELIRLRRTEHGIEEEYLGGCRFVKLIGRHGWQP
jgi:protein-L-isoaspartate(D-aspartate) O-methyltransferase